MIGILLAFILPGGVCPGRIQRALQCDFKRGKYDLMRIIWTTLYSIFRGVHWVMAFWAFRLSPVVFRSARRLARSRCRGGSFSFQGSRLPMIPAFKREFRPVAVRVSSDGPYLIKSLTLIPGAFHGASPGRHSSGPSSHSCAGVSAIQSLHQSLSVSLSVSVSCVASSR